MALNQIKITGKAPSTPTAGPFAPNAGDSEMISRVGSYDSFASGSPETSINVAWGGNTDTFGGAYDTNNILIHHIKVTNEDEDKQKEIHFFQNNQNNMDEDGADYLFNIPMSIAKDDADGKVDTVIDFPIPLLVMGGCRIGIKNTHTYSSFDYEAQVQICYTVLNSTPSTAPYSELKYKYLSAISTEKSEANAEYAVATGTTSTPLYEDIEIWGGMIMNYKNAAGSKEVAQTYIRNAGTVQCLCNGATSSSTTLVVDNKVGTIAAGDRVSGPNISRTSPPTVSSITAQADTTATIVLSSAQTIGNDAEIAFNSEIVSTMCVVKGPTNAITLDYPVGLNRGTIGTLTGGSVNWPGIAPDGYSIHWPTITGFVRPSFQMASEQSPSEVKTWALKAGGSDTQVTFYPFPVYCAGNADNTLKNMKVHTAAAANNDTRATWFYRPVNAKGVDHGWV